MPITQLKKLLKKTDRGRIVWSNIEHAINTDFLNAPLFKELAKQVLMDVDHTLGSDEVVSTIIESISKYTSSLSM